MIDVLIVTALPDEADAARDAGLTSGIASWEDKDQGTQFHHLFGRYTAHGADFQVALWRSIRMGGITVGSMAGALMEHLEPRCLAMCGVCAGNPGDVALGDVIVAEMVYQYDEGKREPERFTADHRQTLMLEASIRLAQSLAPHGLPSFGEPSAEESRLWVLERLYAGDDPRKHPGRDPYLPGKAWESVVRSLESEQLVVRKGMTLSLTDRGKDYIEDKLFYDISPPDKLPFRIRVGPIASGNVVVKDTVTWENLKQWGVRSVLGLEMEAAAIGVTAHHQNVPWVVVKGVMDHADPRKDDRYKPFAARASAEVLFRYLTLHFGGSIPAPGPTCGDGARDDRTKLPPVGPLPERSHLPFQALGDKFVGRVDSLWNLYYCLFQNGRAVVSGTSVIAGTGGLGKTQLAIEYAYRFGYAYPGGVYWVDAERGLSSLVPQVAAPAGIAIDGKAEERDQVEQLWQGLNRLPQPSLIILDNFPENEPLMPYLPPGGRVQTLVTTRRQDLRYATIRLHTLTTEEGIRLLNSGERQFGDDAVPLVERLGGLPLPLELARGYLNYRGELTIADLLEELRQTSDIELLAEFASQYHDHLPGGHSKDIVRTFQLSWDAAPETGRAVLRAMGELAPAPVPRSLLRSVLNLREAPPVRDPLAKALTELARLSLVELDTTGNPIAHRLILAYARYRNVTDSASPFDRCLAAIQEQMDRASLLPDAGTMGALNPFVPHAESLLSASQIRPQDFSQLADRLGTHYQALGRYLDARRALRAALASAERSYEAGHPSIATSQSNLAVVLQALGQLEEARDLLRKALASDEKSYEAGHPSIAIRQSNLAAVLKDLGQLEEARDLLRKALASDEKSYEAGHPSIAVRQSNLALVLKDLGQLEEARDLLRKALASDEKSYEAGHPSIAIRQSNLATVLQDLEQLEEARDLLRKALASAEKSYEAGHPSIARSQSNLAMVLKDLGQLEEARDLLRKALASDEKSYEAGHPAIAVRQSNLALVLKDLGQLEEARDLLRKALASDEKSYGAGHPSIARSQSNLAMVLQDLGQLEEARDLLRKAHQASLQWLGPDHPRTKKIKRNLDGLPS